MIIKKRKGELTMKCLQCGHKITRKQSFCSSCGAAAPECPPKKPLPLKLVLCIALSLSLLANIILLCTQNSSSKFEGNGFSSPEAAITAYAKAFRDGDIEKMISTFAIESYVNCFDLEEYISTVGFYSFYNAEIGFPNESNYQELLNQYTRQNYIVGQIKNGYFTLTNIDNSKATYTFFRDNRDAEIETFLNQLNYPNLDKKLSRIKIGNVLDKDDFSTNEYYSKRLKNYSYLNVEEFCDTAIEIEFDGEQYYLFMLTAKIDGKWYNISFNSPLGILNGMDAFSGSFMKQ